MRILIIDDAESVRKTMTLYLKNMGHECRQAKDVATARKEVEGGAFDAVFLDFKLGSADGIQFIPELLKLAPRLNIVVFTAFASLECAVEAVKKGAFDYLSKPFTPEEIARTLEKIEEARSLERRLGELESVLSHDSHLSDFKTDDPSMRRLYQMAEKVAAAPTTILILGESGTGKSILARAIHQNSAQKDHTFVTVNCPCLSRELLESELFGHVRGAFTGAVTDVSGKVAAAEGGTLFLDEIGELSLEIQSKLLRLLQEKEYERVGDLKTCKADVRVIAATNRDLSKAVEGGEFREDLYYRLNVLPIEMPPLRERRSDLIHIANMHLQFFSRQIGKHIRGFSPETREMLMRYSWPGNLRELRNAIERAVILTAEEEIQPADLPRQLRQDNQQEALIETGAMVSLLELEQEHIKRVLSKTGSIEEAAKVLRINPATLYRKRKRFCSDENSASHSEERPTEANAL